VAIGKEIGTDVTGESQVAGLESAVAPMAREFGLETLITLAEGLDATVEQWNVAIGENGIVGPIMSCLAPPVGSVPLATGKDGTICTTIENA
jgi:hypothetical protein